MMLAHAALLALLVVASTAIQPLRHGWDTVSSMLYGHGHSPAVLNETSLTFLSDHYKMVTFANCYGTDNGTQEEGVLAAAAFLKAKNPSIRVIFYFKSWLASQLAKCSSATATWQAHPEWRLKDDYGNVYDPEFLDVANPNASSFWHDHLAKLAKQRLANGQLALDGFFIDGMENTPSNPFKNMSQARYLSLLADKASIVARLQDTIAPDGQFALTNGLDTRWSADHFAAAGAAMIDHFAILQFVNKTTGELLPEAMAELLFEVVPLLGNRTIQVKGWPGPIIKQRDVWPRSWPGPRTPAEYQHQALLQFNNALSYFLLIAEDNFWWGYSWFWDMLDIEPYDPDSTVPPGFYPELECQLGAPLAAAKMVANWTYVREFEHATVYVDLTSRASSNVTFHGSCPSAHGKVDVV